MQYFIDKNPKELVKVFRYFEIKFFKIAEVKFIRVRKNTDPGDKTIRLPSGRQKYFPLISFTSDGSFERPTNRFQLSGKLYSTNLTSVVTVIYLFVSFQFSLHLRVRFSTKIVRRVTMEVRSEKRKRIFKTFCYPTK